MKDIKETGTNEMDNKETTNSEDAINESNNIDDTTKELGDDKGDTKEMDEKNEVSTDKEDEKEIKQKKLKDTNAKEKKGSLLKKILIVWAVIGVILFLSYYGNNKVDVTKDVYTSKKVTKELDGYTIVQVSDLHNKLFGNNNDKLINKIKKEKPDMIAITGDIVDFNKTDVDIAINTAKRLRKIAVTYYVTGNHEYSISQTYRDKLLKGLEEAGVIILNNRLEILNDNLCVLGIDEREITGHGDAMYESGDPKGAVDSLIKAADLDDDCLSILLAHEPQVIKEYTGADIVFSGHAHGGQFRIPFIHKGIVAPDQGFFPEYTEGRHDYKDTTMYISRGLGNSIIPQRVFNNPELVKVTLKREDVKSKDV